MKMMDDNNSGKEASTGCASSEWGVGRWVGVTIHTVMEKGWGDGMNLSDESK